MLSSSLVRITKLQLAAEQLSTGECWIPPKKDTPCPRAKEKPQQDGRGAKSCLFIYLFILILFLNFTILHWFCQILKWIHHRYTCVPHPELSSLLPPHTIPLGHPSAPAPSIQYHALNLDGRLISYIILYMFQCHSPKSSHPLPLPQSP